MTLPYQLSITNSVLRYPSTQSQTVATVAAVGANLLRTDAPLTADNSWPGVAPTSPESYNSTAATLINALKAQCTAAGLGLIVTVTAVVTTSSVGGVSFSPADFASAMIWLAGQCPGIIWELNNEPNASATLITAALYTESVQASYAGMKAADPTSTIVAGVLSNIFAYAQYGTGSGQNYWSACYGDGIKGNYDAVSVHTYNNFVGPYPDPFDPGTQIGAYALTANLEAFQALMATNSDPAPLWITEFGWDTYTGDATFVTETQQAAFIAKWLEDLITLGLPHVGIYSVSDDQAPDPQAWGLVDANFNPKPSFYAVQSLAGFSGTLSPFIAAKLGGS